MSYKKIVAGVANQSNETASNNKIVFGHPGLAGAYAVIYLILLITRAILYMWVAHAAILTSILACTFIGGFITAWVYTIQWLRRDNSNTRTLIVVNNATQQRAMLEARIAAMTEQYILYKDHEDKMQFRGTVTVTENRHFPAIEAAQEKDATQYILESFDGGSSARGIEKYLNMGKIGKDKISYHQITKTLDLYRKGWNTVHKKVIDAEQPTASDE
jgi:hypothetical protein